MKERLKTILLFLLVGSSLFMTQKLWIKFPTSVTGFFKPETSYSSSYLLSDMIIPNKYLVIFGQDSMTMIYDANKYGLWNSSRNAAAKLLSSTTIEIEELEEGYDTESAERAIVFYMSEKLSTYIAAKAWNVNEPNSITDAIPYIESITVSLGTGDPFFVFSGEGKTIRVTDTSVDFSEITQELNAIEDQKEYDYYYSMSDIFDTVRGSIYIPYEINQNLPVVYVSNSIPLLSQEQKNQFAERFLEQKRDYIRQFTESNGTTIYIYNNMVLKFNFNGTVEYFSSLEDTVEERNLYLSLVTAADFIDRKAFAASRMYLAQTQEIEAEGSLGYKLTFRYRVRGFPVLLGNKQISEYVQIEVFNNQVRGYSQLFRRETNVDLAQPFISGRILSSFDVIDKNYALLERKYLQYTGNTKEALGEGLLKAVLGSIEDVTISYYDPNLKDQDEKLIEIWQINAHGRVYAFNAYTGTLVYEG
jgi:hypothetical protein